MNVRTAGQMGPIVGAGSGGAFGLVFLAVSL